MRMEVEVGETISVMLGAASGAVEGGRKKLTMLMFTCIHHIAYHLVRSQQ